MARRVKGPGSSDTNRASEPSVFNGAASARKHALRPSPGEACSAFSEPGCVMRAARLVGANASKTRASTRSRGGHSTGVGRLEIAPRGLDSAVRIELSGRPRDPRTGSRRGTLGRVENAAAGAIGDVHPLPLGPSFSSFKAPEVDWAFLRALPTRLSASRLILGNSISLCGDELWTHFTSTSLAWSLMLEYPIERTACSPPLSRLPIVARQSRPDASRDTF